MNFPRSVPHLAATRTHFITCSRFILYPSIKPGDPAFCSKSDILLSLGTKIFHYFVLDFLPLFSWGIPFATADHAMLVARLIGCSCILYSDRQWGGHIGLHLKIKCVIPAPFCEIDDPENMTVHGRRTRLAVALTLKNCFSYSSVSFALSIYISFSKDLLCIRL